MDTVRKVLLLLLEHEALFIELRFPELVLMMSLLDDVIIR